MAGEWSRSSMEISGRHYRIQRLAVLEEAGLGRLSRLPRSIRVLLENLLRHEDGATVTREDIAALASWRADVSSTREIAFRPARVLLQDFTGVPSIVDLAAMRDAMAELGGSPQRINPLRPADLVVDHSVQVDRFGDAQALARNTELEFARNGERYAFLRWGQTAFEGLRVVPPSTGIVHQVNIECLAQVVFCEREGEDWIAFPDTLVGTDSHSTMVNALGVLGWGVGGIEAEACLLGQPISMLIPDVVGCRLHGTLPEGATATDLVLTVTQRLREHGVVGKFVEFFGPGLAALSLADRATVANMVPEYGATIGFFPVDEKTLEYLRLTGREEEQIECVEAYLRSQGLFFEAADPEPEYSSLVELDLAGVEPSLAGPARPQDRISLRHAKASFAEALGTLLDKKGEVSEERLASEVPVRLGTEEFELRHGSLVIAAITSCTNTSNPSVLVAAGLLAKRAVERGLEVPPWVKTSLAPGSRVVPDYLARAGLLEPLERLRFYVVGFGCTTCIGNSGPLPDPIAKAVREGDLVVTAVLSGNRNFEGRINALVRANYLASPPLVVAYALAGRMDIDLYNEPLGHDRNGHPVFLREIWPAAEEIERTVAACVDRALFRECYGRVFEGSPEWQAIPVPKGERYPWAEDSTYILRPPFFDGMTRDAPDLEDIRGARVLALLGDSVTTDHVSPAGAIPPDSPAGRYLRERGVAPVDFNSFGSRRGNHEVMVRGTFGNIRLRNRLVPGTEGGYTRLLPGNDVVPIFDAARHYAAEGVPLLVIAGKEYGTGSSRDWAAKGTRLLGVRAVLATSFERIHRSNLIGMGVLPLQFPDGESAESLGLSGDERYDVEGVEMALKPAAELSLRVQPETGASREIPVRARIDTPDELEYYRHGGILPYVLRRLLG
ncbi:MAG: aconitate hydratase AcnA [Myxococcota bacterium]